MRRAAVAILLLALLAVCPAFAAEKAAPTVTITSPEPGLTIASDSVEVTAVYSAPEGAGVKLVELVVDGLVVQSSELDPAEPSGVLTLTWEASGYLDGRHSVVMRVTDTQDRPAKTSIAVSLKRGLPDLRPIKITAPPSGARVAGVTAITVEATDAEAVKYVIFLVDDVFKALSNVRPFSYRWDTSGYLNGLHRLQAKAYLADGTEAKSFAIEVRVDNPSGATTLKQPAPVAAALPPKPVPAVAPARAAEAPLPPPVHSESATPATATVEVLKAEIGAPGTAPYLSASGDLIQPPTTTLAARAGSEAQMEVATVGEVAEASAPSAPGVTALATPPLPEPQRVSTDSAPSAPALPDAAASAATPELAAPVQVATLPAPAAAMDRTPAPSLPAAPALEAQPAEASVATPAAAAIAAPPVPKPTATAGAIIAPRPVTSSVAAKPAPAAPSAPRQLALTPPKPAPAPKQIAMLPPKPVAAAPAPKLIAEPKPTTDTYVVQPGDCLYTIAEAHDVTPYQLAKANGLEAPYIVHPGQRLAVPEHGVYLNGQPVLLVATVTDPEGGRLQSLALRPVVEGLGGNVSWDAKTRQATAQARGHNVVVTIGQIRASVDGKPVGMTMDAILFLDRTLVPARFLGQAFDLSVTYDKGVTRIAAK